MRREWVMFAAGFLSAGILLGSAAAADVLHKQITVTYRPLRYLFDGTEKIPPSDQQGFIYNGRTYVPLRFMSEALGKAVAFDPDTSTIYVGRRPSPLPEIWSGYTTQGSAAIKLEYFREGAQDLRGVEVRDALLVTALAMPRAEQDSPSVPTAVKAEIPLPAGSKAISGTLFVPVHYFGHGEARRVALLTVLDERNVPIYRSEALTTDSQGIPFEVSVEGKSKVKVIINLYPEEGVPVPGGLIGSQVGIADFKIVTSDTP